MSPVHGSKEFPRARAGGLMSPILSPPHQASPHPIHQSPNLPHRTLNPHLTHPIPSLLPSPTPPSALHPTQQVPTPTPIITPTFWSSVLLLAALTCRVTSSWGSRGHLEAPVMLFLAGGLWATSTTTPGEAVMPKVVQPLGAELWSDRGRQRHW